MLSDDQVAFLKSKSYFLLKKEVDEKLNSLLYTVQQAVLENWKSSTGWNLPNDASRVPGKIIKGYNYRGFPYQVSDFPTVFNGKEFFIFRVVVWYGNTISVNLILSDKYKEQYLDRLESFCSGSTFLLKFKNIWETDLSQFKSILVNESSIAEVRAYFEKNKSIRLYRSFNMNQINMLDRLTVECFNDWFTI